jgi:signal-transduction protein with cAMP-binding, CBS, and nucleotidyltransferase domain
MLSAMEEIARFLARHPPFDRLPGKLLARTAATVEIEFFFCAKAGSRAASCT